MAYIGQGYQIEDTDQIGEKMSKNLKKISKVLSSQGRWDNFRTIIGPFFGLLFDIFVMMTQSGRLFSYDLPSVS